MIPPRDDVLRRLVLPPIRARLARGCLALLAVVACGAPAPPGPAAARTDRVAVVEPPGRPAEWGYDPTSIEVASGTTVVWHNGGVEFHTVTSDDPGRTFDVALEAGKDGSVTFARAGTFAYHCGVHPDMKGVVHVCDGACR